MENLSIADDIHQFGYISDNKIYLKSFLHFEDRQIGEVKISNADTFKYFENRFKLFTTKVNDLFALIESSENKGSFLQKLLHLKFSCGTYEAIGDFTSIYQLLSEKEVYLNELIEINRVKNLEIKQALLGELEVVKMSNDWVNATEEIKEIKNKWIRVGGVGKEFTEKLENEFKASLEIFYSRRQVFYDERNALNVIKLQKYNDLKTKAKALLSEPNIREALESYKKLQSDWKNVGIIPKADLAPIMSAFKYVGLQLSRKYKEYKNNRVVLVSTESVSSIDRLRTINEAVALILKKLPPRGDDEVKQYQIEWKKIGYVKDISFKELDSSFKRNCARIMDLYFMRKLCNKRHEGFFKMPLQEQLVIQIGVLKELIARDSETIENFENSYVKPETNNDDSSYDVIFGAKLNMQKRGLETKKSILLELEGKLLK